MASQQPTSSGPVASSDTFYYANGERIALSPSSRYVAVRGAGAGGAAALADRASMRGLSVTTLDIPEYDLSIVSLPPDAQRARAGGMRDALSAALADAATAGPMVYEPTSALGDAEALIAVGEVIVRFREGTDEGAVSDVLRAYDLEVIRRDYPEPGALLVRARSDAEAIPAANALQERADVEYAQPNFVHLAPRLGEMGLPNSGDGLGFGTVDERMMGGVTFEPPIVGSARDSDPVVANRVAADMLVDLPIDVEPVTEPPSLSTEPSAGPMAPALNDPLLASQYGLTRTRALEAFDITMGSNAISVAVLDEGCDIAHEDINYRLPGYNALDRTDNPRPAGNDAHGTACAGIVSMRANNGRGGVGMAPNCPTLPIRIARGVGGGSWYTTDAIVADGIRAAVVRGASVLSNSYQMGASSAVTNAFQFARTNGRSGLGCAMAAASGNGDVRGVIFPARLSASIPGMVAVGASNQWDQRKSRTSADGETWWGSNYGPELDLVAPGVKIPTTDISGSAGYAAGNYTPTFNGTSSATPHVAGLMALVLSVDPGLRGWEVEDILKLTARDLGTSGRDEQFGFGRIDARRAVEAAQRIAVRIIATPVFLGRGRECYMRISARVSNPGINAVRLNTLTIKSHSPDWSTIIDRFDLNLQPGGVIQPRTGDHALVRNVLLRANGNALAWSTRWSASWGYTFWRPSAPVFALGAAQPAFASVNTDGVLAQESLGDARGAQHGVERSDSRAAEQSAASSAANGESEVSLNNGADSIVVDRQSRSITITIR